jgi:hypothetical protein
MVAEYRAGRVELAETTTAPVFSNCAATVPLAIPTFVVQSVGRPG